MRTTVTYSEALIRRAIFHWWIRFIGWHGFTAIAVVPVACLWLTVHGTMPWLGYGGLAAWAFFVVVALGVIEDRELMCAKVRENGGQVL